MVFDLLYIVKNWDIPIPGLNNVLNYADKVVGNSLSLIKLLYLHVLLIELGMESSENENERAAIKRTQQRDHRRQVAGELVQDFAQNTSLHGLRYIAENKLSLVEKIFWTISVVTSLTLCALLMWNVWVKWQTAPIIVTVSDDLVSIQEVPFPSVTICPQAKLKSSVCSNSQFDLMEYKYYKDMNDTDDVMLYEAICLILGIANEKPPKKFNVGIIKKMFEVSPTLDEVVHTCNLYGTFSDCKELFKPVLTLEGVCFTMNSLAANEILRNDTIQNNYTYLHTSEQTVGWSHSVGYSHFNSSVDVYPRRGQRSTYGRPDAWIILKHVNEDRIRVYNSHNDGFKVYLHHPADLPQSSVYFYAAPNEQRITLGLKLNVVNTSSTLRSYSPDTRRCYFPGERQLRYFHTYTENNCKLECLSNYTIQQCGCVWFHMPQPKSTNIETTLTSKNKGSVTKMTITTKPAVIAFSSKMRVNLTSLRLPPWMWNSRLPLIKIFCVITCTILVYLQQKVWNDNETTTICRANYWAIPCCHKATREFDEREGNYNQDGRCRCYPLCLNTQYEADIVKILNYDNHDLNQGDLIQNTTEPSKSSEPSEYTFTRIELFYKSSKFVSMDRSELFGMTDFLANCGGLLGLFLGFSFLSILEIVYFFTLRLGCSLRRSTPESENITDKIEELN